MSVADELLDPNFSDHYPFPNQGPGSEGARKGMAEMWKAFPDLHVTDDLIAEGDKVVIRSSLAGSLAHIAPDEVCECQRDKLRTLSPQVIIFILNGG